MVRAIAILAAAVMCAACACHDQLSDGVGAPKATPAGIVDRLNNEINVALAEPKVIPGPLKSQMPMRSAMSSLCLIRSARGLLQQRPTLNSGANHRMGPIIGTVIQSSEHGCAGGISVSYRSGRSPDWLKRTPMRLVRAISALSRLDRGGALARRSHPRLRRRPMRSR